MLLENKTAVVTGCNRGIGKAILTRFAENGANVIAVVRKESETFSQYCDELEKKNDIKIHTVYADFSSEDEVNNAVKEIRKLKLPIDILVNNIGISNAGSMLALTKMEDIKKVFQVNFFSTIYFTQLLSKSMIKQRKGSVVFVSSTAVYDAWSNVEYTASKAAIVGAVRRLAIELGVYSIRVNAVAPALTDTDMAKGMSQEDTEIAISRNIMKRKGKPEEIADSVLFLASDMASFITGQILRVDGGLLQ